MSSVSEALPGFMQAEGSAAQLHTRSMALESDGPARASYVRVGIRAPNIRMTWKVNVFALSEEV
ncbi:hypothetical protein TREES_T100004896 [Tupaia chinensis]|uniref:Uncharacterized protein n=1 Tax=Tupaia chinensis TaxID=246437 RepID=L9LEA0_TUPCH|nr:hypothetical protein TREES_T100004896 [Tupaia chinensis]